MAREFVAATVAPVVRRRAHVVQYMLCSARGLTHVAQSTVFCCLLVHVNAQPNVVQCSLCFASVQRKVLCPELGAKDQTRAKG